MTPNSQPERRRFSRVPFDGYVKAERIPQPSPNRVWYLLPQDVSESGLRLSSPELFPVKSHLLLDFAVEVQSAPICIVGEVAWVVQTPNQDHWSIGIAFSDVSGSGPAWLSRIVEERRSAG